MSDWPILEIDGARINRLNDRFFKYLFGRLEHRHLLLDFINDALFPEAEARFSSVEFINSELVQGGERIKLSRLDLSAKLEDGSTVDIEVQVVNQHDFRKRIPHYWAMRHAGKLPKGHAYDTITPTIFICLLAFDLLKEETEYRNVYGICNRESGRVLCEDMTILYLELPKFRARKKRARTGLERWLSYLGSEGDEKMKEIVSLDREVREALDLEKLFWGSEEERFHYIAQQKVIRDALDLEAQFLNYQTRLKEADAEKQRAEAKGRAEGEAKGRAEGRAEGWAEGEAKGRADTALRMIAHGMDTASVALFTGLEPDEIEALRKRGERPGEEA